MDQYDFSGIYITYKQKVWGLVSKYVSTCHDKEDLFQEVFLKVHKALPKFRGEAEVGTWIYRIAVNTAITFLQKQKRYRLLKDLLDKMRVFEAEEADLSVTGELYGPLEKLNPKQRMILVLAEVEEKKLEEIAQTLNLPVGTVKSNLNRAKEILRKELGKND
ncbi:MAG: sigma-70 family RNA polymerase sigma factor [Candidatus Saganbacteria bacterium]|nr:sigma-70 family RNA polymerase sigma factor [Candidatus Saganbacteria bacterium]